MVGRDGGVLKDTMNEGGGRRLLLLNRLNDTVLQIPNLQLQSSNSNFHRLKLHKLQFTLIKNTALKTPRTKGQNTTGYRATGQVTEGAEPVLSSKQQGHWVEVEQRHLLFSGLNPEPGRCETPPPTPVGGRGGGLLVRHSG